MVEVVQPFPRKQAKIASPDKVFHSFRAHLGTGCAGRIDA